MDEIIAYVYRADIFHPRCIVDTLPTYEGGAFDGWRNLTPEPTVEGELSEIADAFGFDRDDEYSFDSGDFPKVVFGYEDMSDQYCGHCLDPIEES